ncbi:hypothetical protein FCT18_21240 [Lysinibacillus sphaericus]|uniref:Uncharacterized protein n=1 Tax=Lysinibacillus sphaericus TaxID=1421 RepID=A0A2S0JWV5_LYSSH|nr:hypothetical protein [Lysinibacillus sphaericus]AVK95625.1 hypothetical protein LS41612_04710 [Lysinibacillus sphaericus]MED4546480.1 hypothetical protein [Lysinibacillus sphaericus]TKI16337.1 hypothetical protein FCT18_21240 [Lysinibacillus sphaericus]SUV18658.1 Uncharacterised protein [Lysinibacillus sphaericus]GEC84658.1 hypothetical protein LSP03_44010 [Lysinibacillus sphaericus]
MDYVKFILGSAFISTLISGIYKLFLDKKIEKFKTDLQLKFTTEQERLNQKRNVYINLIDSMAIFIGNRIPPNLQDQYKFNFLQAYDIAWLWASDEVMKAMSEFLEHNMKKTTGQDWSHDKEKELFAKCILEMRKDIGFKDSKLDKIHYKFVNF